MPIRRESKRRAKALEDIRLKKIELAEPAFDLLESLVNEPDQCKVPEGDVACTCARCAGRRLLAQLAPLRKIVRDEDRKASRKRGLRGED